MYSALAVSQDDSIVSERSGCYVWFLRDSKVGLAMSFAMTKAAKQLFLSGVSEGSSVKYDVRVEPRFSQNLPGLERKLLNTGGVKLALSSGIVPRAVYVGQAKCLKERIKSHVRQIEKINCAENFDFDDGVVDGNDSSLFYRRVSRAYNEVLKSNGDYFNLMDVLVVHEVECLADQLHYTEGVLIHALDPTGNFDYELRR